ncbi:MAG: exosome complex RNA-binding protein Rrp4 [Candidatus Thorarchaeota archaeon]
MAVYFQKREVVVPGQLLAEGRYRASFGTYDEGEKIYSALVGLAELRGNTVKVVALEGVYIPREGDLVLGTITMVMGNNWKVDIGGPYLASLHANNALRRPYDDDISRYMDIGDVIAAEVIAFDRVTGPFLGMKGRGLRRLDSGMILEIRPAKIPRVIGRRGSMINMIQDILKIQTMVGQNGRIWIRTSNTDVMRLAIKAFKMIEAQAHTSKLTDRVKEMLEEEMTRIRGDEPPEEMSEESMEVEDSEESEDSAEPVEDIKEEDTAEGEEPVVTEEPLETDVADKAIEDSPKDAKEAETESEETETETTEEVSE